MKPLLLSLTLFLTSCSLIDWINKRDPCDRDQMGWVDIAKGDENKHFYLKAGTHPPETFGEWGCFDTPVEVRSCGVVSIVCE
jgi:hypothetical protein